jgi:hypothetical protein
MSSIPAGARLKVYEVAAKVNDPKTGLPDPNKAAFFVRRVDAERWGRHVNRDVTDGYVTDQETISYLLGPRHVPDALSWFLREGVITLEDLTAEEAHALVRAFGSV